MIRHLNLVLIFLIVRLLHGQQPSQACHPLTADQISGRDLAAAVPQLMAIPQDLKLGYAPAPGAQRVFRVSQLQELSKAYGIEAKISEPVCFAWSLRPLPREEMLAAIQKSLAGQTVQIEITDESHYLVPEGELVFPLQGLSGQSDKPEVWNGFVAYAGVRRFKTWAQVRITVHQKQIVAARAIRAGETIEASALKDVDFTGPFRRSAAIQDPAQASGQCARWPIAAGTALTVAMLVPPDDVEKEQLVTVHIVNGAAHIETQGIADDAGYRGNVIRVRNPKTGRIFKARIDDPGVVTVVPGGDVGLVPEDKKS